MRSDKNPESYLAGLQLRGPPIWIRSLKPGAWSETQTPSGTPAHFRFWCGLCAGQTWRPPLFSVVCDVNEEHCGGRRPPLRLWRCRVGVQGPDGTDSRAVRSN